MARTLVHEAVHTQQTNWRRGLLERLFAMAFDGLVYPQIWEDPLVDLEALELDRTTRLVTIASGGCNVMSYLLAGPAAITAVDLNAHHVALNRLKIAAARHLPDHAAFFDLFARAGVSANVETYAQLRPALDDDTRAYWDGRDTLGRRRSR